MNHPMQPMYLDESGRPRFRPNKIVRFLLDTSKNDLNDLHYMPFEQDDWVQFIQLIGYDLVGFGELSFIPSQAYEQAEQAAAKLKE